MPNMIHIAVDDPAGLLNAGMYDAGAVVRAEWSATEAGVYASVGTAALVAGTTAYTIYHTAGTSTTWYRTRYESSGGGIASAYSAPFLAGTEGGYLVDVDDVKATLGITNTTDDAWLQGICAAVTGAIEIVTGRWFVTRGNATWYFDCAEGSDELEVPMGITAATYVGIASVDQPDGTGTYTEIATGYYLDPPAQMRPNGEPATRIGLATTAGPFPTWGKRRIKVTGTWGWAVIPPRVQQIATAAITRAYRARSSGGADYAVIGPDGGMKILRDFAPAELEELRAAFGRARVA